MASDFMRSRMSEMLEAPPSAVCSTEMPCEALVAAWLSVVTSEEMRVEMARPAASSEAWVMREPEASLDRDSDCSEALMLR